MNIRWRPTIVAPTLALLACSGGPVEPTGRSEANVASQALAAAPASAPNLVLPRSAIVVAAEPLAQCEVQGNGVSNWLTADDKGELRFVVPKEWGANITVSCKTATQGLAAAAPKSNISLNLNDPSTFTAEPVDRVATVKGTRPALTGDPLSYSQADLLKKGYPARPDPNAASAAYAKWVRIVSKDSEVVDAKSVADLGAHNGGTFRGRDTRSNWSGQVLVNNIYGTPTTYEMSYIDVTTPPLNGYANDVASGNSTAQMSVWGGLGGYTEGALIQNGVAARLGSTYYFYEYYQCCDSHGNWSGPELDVSGFTVNAGDEVIYTAFASDSSGNISLNGGWGAYNFYNVNTNQTAGNFFVQAVSGQPTFVGTTADFIAERSSNSATPPVPYPLDDYNGSWAQGYAADCVASAPYCVWHSDQSDNWRFVDMKNGSTLLSKAYFPGLSDTSNDINIFFQWHAWK